MTKEVKEVVETTKISRTEMTKLIEGSKGRVMRVTFIKKNGDVRVINCNNKKNPKTELGYISVWDMQNKGFRLIDPRTLINLKLNKVEYEAKGKAIPATAEIAE